MPLMIFLNIAIKGFINADLPATGEKGSADIKLVECYFRSDYEFEDDPDVVRPAINLNNAAHAAAAARLQLPLSHVNRSPKHVLVPDLQ